MESAGGERLTHRRAEPVTPPVRPGRIIEVEVSGLGHDGEGVGRHEGYALFVPGALPGDRIRARIGQVKKNYARGELVQVVRPSADRVPPQCSVFDQCGGCALQSMDYAAQLRWKRRQVVDALERIAGLKDTVVHETLGMTNPGNYRNKGQYPVASGSSGLTAGFFARGTHRVVDTVSCGIQHPLNNRIVAETLRLCRKAGISAYDESTGTGFLRHILVKIGFATRQAMCVLVTNGADFPGGADFGLQLHEAVPEVVSVMQNINVCRTNVILGESTRVLWGRETIEDELCGLRFRISARSFYQVNPVQTEVLYRKAMDYAGLGGAETALDLYCGIGTITLLLARQAAKAYGVEYVEEAVRDARTNAELNGIRNVEFRAGDAAAVLGNLAGEGVRFDVAVLDPPRSGCDAGVLRTLAGLGVPRIVYVSCNPSSLARDLKLLAGLGYGVDEVQPVDMFPHTSHVECVACAQFQPARASR